MKYEEMTMELNKAVADYLDGLKLSDKAREQIIQTDINIIKTTGKRLS